MPADSPADRIPLPVVYLTAAGSGPTTTTDVRLTVAGRQIHLNLTLPTGPAPLRDLLPVFHGLTNLVVDGAEQDVAWTGERVSCRAGCGACCRQMVPISESEAHALRRLVDDL